MNMNDFSEAGAAPAISSTVEMITGWGQFDSHAEILSNGEKNTRPTAGKPYSAITGKEIVAMVQNPPSVPKAEAQWMIPSSYRESDGRTFEVQAEQGEFWSLPLDEDGNTFNNLSLADIEAAVLAACGPVTRLIYSTRSSTAEKRKWRALIPLMRPISGADYSDTVAAFNARLIEASGGVLIPDPVLERPGQLIFLPNRGEFYEFAALKGDRLELTPDHPIIKHRDRIRAERAAIEAAARKKRQERMIKALADPSGSASIIEAFNTANTVADMMERHGYVMSRNGRDWRSPNSSSGTYAVKDFGHCWFSFSGSDDAAGIGQRHAGGRVGDAFDLFTYYEHNGDQGKAVAAYAREIGLDYRGQRVRETALLAEIERSRQQKAPGQAPGQAGQAGQAGQKPKLKFELIRSDNLTFSEPEFLIDGLIETETFGLFFGDPGSGKSFAALDVACCVATGKAFHGRKVKAGAVIYICGEGKNGIKRRLTAWEKHYGVSLAGKPLFVSRVAAQFLSPESIKDLVEAIDGAAAEAGEVALIIIDTLNRNMGAGDESSTRDMTAFVSAVDMVKDRYSATALVVHHTGHGNKERARGSMSLLGALDAEYRVEKACDGTVTMTNTKMKDAASPAPLAFELAEIEVGRDRLGEAITSAVLIQTEAPAATRRELPAKVKLALETFFEAKRRAGHRDDPAQGVHVDGWRAVFYERSTADNAEAKKKAFQRYRDELVTRGILAVADDVYRLLTIPQGFTF